MTQNTTAAVRALDEVPFLSLGRGAYIQADQTGLVIGGRLFRRLGVAGSGIGHPRLQKIKDIALFPEMEPRIRLTSEANRAPLDAGQRLATKSLPGQTGAASRRRPGPEDHRR